MYVCMHVFLLLFKPAVSALATNGSLFWTCLHSASAHTRQQSEGSVARIQNPIWKFCKTSILHKPQVTRGKNKEVQIFPHIKVQI